MTEPRDRESRSRTTRTPRERKKLGDVDAVPPGVITSIHERRAGSVRYIIAIDTHPSATISAQAIAELGLKVGKRIDETEALALQTESARVAVFDKAVELLAARARSVRDLRLRLRRAGAESPLIDVAIERLASLGLLNDAEYARNVANLRATSGGVSKRRIGQELQKRGISRDVADAAIEETLEVVELDELGSARAVATKRMRSLKALDQPTQRRRLYAFLARRGYTGGVIAQVIKEIGAGELEHTE